MASCARAPLWRSAPPALEYRFVRPGLRDVDPGFADRRRTGDPLETPGIAGPRRNGGRASCEVIRSRDFCLAWMNAPAAGMSDGPVEP